MTRRECEDIVRELQKVMKGRGTLMDRAQEAIMFLLAEVDALDAELDDILTGDFGSHDD